MVSRALSLLALSALTVGCSMSSDYQVSGNDSPPLGDNVPSTGVDVPAGSSASGNGSAKGTGSITSGAHEPAPAGTGGAMPAPCERQTVGPLSPQAALTMPQPAKSTSWGGVGLSLPQAASFSSSFLSAKHSDFLTVTHFGARVPPKALVVGVTFTMQKYSALGTTQDEHTTITIKGAAAGAPRQSPDAWPTVIAATSYGGADDAWGMMLTGADVNDPDFGISLSAVANSNLANAGVKDVAMTVTYCK